MVVEVPQIQDTSEEGGSHISEVNQRQWLITQGKAYIRPPEQLALTLNNDRPAALPLVHHQSSERQNQYYSHMLFANTKPRKDSTW